MKLPLRCACGSVQGEVDLERAWTRVSCYCRDCQAFARFLGRPGLMDAAGGSDIAAMAPDAVRFTAGQEHLACMSLGPNGLLRWYADCCRTPLANLTRNPKFFYCGLATACLEDTPPGTLQARLGARGAIAVQAASATAPVRGAPLRRSSMCMASRCVLRKSSAGSNGPHCSHRPAERAGSSQPATSQPAPVSPHNLACARSIRAGGPGWRGSGWS